jgi:glycosyltransferase involved in cell wall biosynthesis
VSVAVVLPTYNRCEALRHTLDGLLALVAVDELLVVDDGSTDGTAALLGSVEHAALRVLRLERNGGTPAARNFAAAAARSEWIVFAEDDCGFPPDYAASLREEAAAHGALVVGAPMVHVAPGEDVAAAVERERRARRGPGGLDEVAGFPGAATATPLLPATALVHRPLVERLRFDEGYRGNAYREETDFFLRALASGARCVLTPRTYFWEERRYDGGQARGRAAEEYWTLRNNLRFLRRHAEWLRANGYIASPLHEQRRFAARRLRRLVGGGRAPAPGS